jgi:hypothetical protein
MLFVLFNSHHTSHMQQLTQSEAELADAKAQLEEAHQNHLSDVAAERARAPSVASKVPTAGSLSTEDKSILAAKNEAERRLAAARAQVKSLQDTLAEREAREQRALRDQLNASRLARQNRALRTGHTSPGVRHDSEAASQLGELERNEKRLHHEILEREAELADLRQRNAAALAQSEFEVEAANQQLARMQDRLAAARKGLPSERDLSVTERDELEAATRELQHENAELKRALAEAGRFAPAALVARLDAAHAQLGNASLKAEDLAAELSRRREADESSGSGTVPALVGSQADTVAQDVEDAQEAVVRALEMARGLKGGALQGREGAATEEVAGGAEPRDQASAEELQDALQQNDALRQELLEAQARARQKELELEDELLRERERSRTTISAASATVPIYELVRVGGGGLERVTKTTLPEFTDISCPSLYRSELSTIWNDRRTGPASWKMSSLMHAERLLRPRRTATEQR